MLCSCVSLFCTSERDAVLSECICRFCVCGLITFLDYKIQERRFFLSKFTVFKFSNHNNGHNSGKIKRMCRKAMMY